MLTKLQQVYTFVKLHTKACLAFLSAFLAVFLLSRYPKRENPGAVNEKLEDKSEDLRRRVEAEMTAYHNVKAAMPSHDMSKVEAELRKRGKIK